MTVVITGCASLSAAGETREALAASVLAGSPSTAKPIASTFDGALPSAYAHVIEGFDVRAALGRRGTSFFDRWTALSVVASGRALTDAGIDVDAAEHDRLGLVVATTAGSLKSTIDYSVETLVQERPYLVNPALFPNTVMNCAAGQSAIWHHLKGVNATVGGGPLGIANALRYAEGALTDDRVDVILVGAAEELTPHSAWMAERMGHGDRAGEGAAFFVAELPQAAAARGVPVLASVVANATAFVPRRTARRGPAHAERPAPLAGVVGSALASAGLDPAEVKLAFIADDVVDGEGPELGLTSARTIDVGPVHGACGAALPALQLATAIALAECDPSLDGSACVLAARAREGAVAVAVLRLGA